LGGTTEELASALEIGRSIDTERNGVNDGDVDPEAVLEGAQLLEAFSDLERGGRQGDEALEGCAPVSIDADVMVKGALAVGGGGAREIEGTHAALLGERGGDDLDDVRVRALVLVGDLGGKRRDVGTLGGERLHARPDEARVERRQVALQVDDDFRLGVGIDAVQGLEDAVGARYVIGARHDRLAAGVANGVHDRIGVGCDHHTADLGGACTPPDVNDHRLAGNVDHRFPGEARRPHPCRNDDQCIRHGFVALFLGPGVRRSSCGSLDTKRLDQT
jgi:hypothetical protein